MGATTVPVTTKRPFLAWEVLPGQAPRANTGRKRCVAVSPKNATGATATANTPYRVTDATSVAVLGGYGQPWVYRTLYRTVYRTFPRSRCSDESILGSGCRTG